MISSFKAGLQPVANDSSAQHWALDELDLRGDAAPEPALAPETDAVLADVAAARELAAARAQAIADAYARGVEDGRTERAEGERARLGDATAAAERALDGIRAGEARWHGTIEENICALAIAVARQVVVSELRSDSEMVAELVRRALAEFPIDQPVRVRVHPLDLAAIDAMAATRALPVPADGGREMRWLADATLTPGGCVVEGRDRIIDGRVDTALERLYRRLTHTHA